MQPGHSLIDPPRAHHAVLSRRALQHLDHLPKTNRPFFEQAQHHAEVVKKRAQPGRDPARWGRGRRTLAPSRIECLLLYPALRFPIVSDATPRRLLLPVSPTTAERTAQVSPPSVARVSEKKDPAVPTSGQALSQPGLHPQHRSQHHVIRQHQGSDRAVAIPLRIQPKMGCDLSCKNPRLWLWTLKLLKAPLS